MSEAAQAARDELERRRLIAKIEGKPLEEPAPARTAQDFLADMPLPEQRPTQQGPQLEDETPGSLAQIGASIGRGAFGDLANKAGSALATAGAVIPAGLTPGTPALDISDTYEDILGTERMKEADFAESNPVEDARARNLGLGLTVGLSGAMAPIRAAGGALAKTGASALASTKSGAQATRGLANAVKRQAGKVASSAGQIGKKTAQGTAAGTLVGEPVEGGKVGLAAGILFNTPIGRAFLASKASKIGGEKLSKAVYYGLHPASRSKLMEAFKKFTGGK